MGKHRIKSRKDLQKVQRIYESDSYFEVLETGEEVSITDFMYLYDNQRITIQEVAK